MTEDMLMTIWYLSLMFLGLPTLYFLSSSGSEREENKKRALKIYPVCIFSILLITVLIYGVNKTKKAIGHAFGEFVFFVFNATLGFTLLICILLLFLHILSLRSTFSNIKRKISHTDLITKIHKMIKKD